MSNMMPMGRRKAMLTAEIPTGSVISTYDTYMNAQLAVGALARSEFPVNQVAIVGNNIKSVERVTGKLGYGRMALTGAFSGSYLGLFLALVLMILQPGQAMAGIFFAAIAIGAGFGMLFGVISYAMNKRRRDFSSVMQIVATRYDLVTESDLVFEARNILSRGVQQP